MGIRMPGMSGIDPRLVEKLIEVERAPVEQAKKRKEKIVDQKKEVEKLQSYLANLDAACNGIKNRTDFYKFKVDSSHPDIIEGAITGEAMLGSFEFEVRGLARNEKELAFGFPDKNETPVGFGYMQIEREDMEPADITIEPGATLDDVAKQINEQDLGVRAMVINTKYYPESWRLLVISEKSGNEARISIDEDTTFLEFQEQVTGRNLDVLFEDVPVTDDDNILEQLIEGLNLTIKRAEPGTRVQVAVNHDLEKTLEAIKVFVEKYNEIAKFAAEQSKDARSGDPGKLSGDSTVKGVMRQLQMALFPPAPQSSKFQTLAEVGITTNPKTGELKLDEAKVRAALTEDYDAVAQLFIRSKYGDGVGERIADRIKAFRDPAAGMVKRRIKGLEDVITNQDKDIERRERLLDEKQENIKRRFAALEGQMSGLKAQGDFLSARLGGGDGGQGAPQGGGA